MREHSSENLGKCCINRHKIYCINGPNVYLDLASTNNVCTIKASLLKEPVNQFLIIFDHFIPIILGGGQLQSQTRLYKKQANNGHYDSAMQDV